MHKAIKITVLSFHRSPKGVGSSNKEENMEESRNKISQQKSNTRYKESI